MAEKIQEFMNQDSLSISSSIYNHNNNLAIWKATNVFYMQDVAM